MTEWTAVILTDGPDKEMVSDLSTALHDVCGWPIIKHVWQALKEAGVTTQLSLVPAGELAQFQECQVSCGEKEAPPSTVTITERSLAEVLRQQTTSSGPILLISAALPLIRGESLKALMDYHQSHEGGVTVVQSGLTGEGSSALADSGNSEAHLFSPLSLAQLAVFDQEVLEVVSSEKVAKSGDGGELLSLIQRVLEAGTTVEVFGFEDPMEGLRVTNRVQLARASQVLQHRINHYHLMKGVTLVQAETTYIEAGVRIAPETVIEGGVYLKGMTQIGRGCMIGHGTEVVDCQIGEDVQIRQSFLEASRVGDRVTIGPHAHLRPKADLGDDVHIGNYVEVKNSKLGPRTKAGHLSYIGDADLAHDINIGCGVVFANYDGINKHRSRIGAHSFIGSNSTIVAPIQLGDRVFVAAGSTITQDGQDEELLITRPPQVNKANYWQRYMANKQKEK